MATFTMLSAVCLLISEASENLLMSDAIVWFLKRDCVRRREVDLETVSVDPVMKYYHAQKPLNVQDHQI